MKSISVAFAVFVVLFTTAAFPQSNSQAAFEKLKSLEGSWVGRGSQGQPVQVSFRVTSNGSAIMSEIEGSEDMISMIHLDGPNRLLLTHYCGAGNQPRMQASVSPDGKVITFNFFDGTNIPPDGGYMQRMVLTLIDDNHHTEEWTFLDHGKEQKEFFDLHRAL